MRKIDGDALKAIITSWIARTTHGEQTILSESIRETLRGVIEAFGQFYKFCPNCGKKMYRKGDKSDA